MKKSACICPRRIDEKGKIVRNPRCKIHGIKRDPEVRKKQIERYHKNCPKCDCNFPK